MFYVEKEYNKLLVAARKIHILWDKIINYFPNENDYYYTFVKIVDTSYKITEGKYETD